MTQLSAHRAHMSHSALGLIVSDVSDVSINKYIYMYGILGRVLVRGKKNVGVDIFVYVYVFSKPLTSLKSLTFRYKNRVRQGVRV